MARVTRKLRTRGRRGGRAPLVRLRSKGATNHQIAAPPLTLQRRPTHTRVAHLRARHRASPFQNDRGSCMGTGTTHGHEGTTCAASREKTSVPTASAMLHPQ